MTLNLRLHVSGLMMAMLFVLLTAFSASARPASIREDEKAPAAAAKKATVMRGRASWYGREHQGHRTSNGERFDRNKYTCAHKTLPFGTKLRVSNPETGESVVVRVTDRGPFRHQRILDLSEVAARPLGIVTHGAVSVVAEVVSPDTPLGPTNAPENLAALATDSTVAVGLLADVRAGASEAADVTLTPEPTATYVIQAGTFGDARNARAVMDKIQSLEPKLLVTTVTTSTLEGKALNRVVVGRFATAAEADTVRQRLARLGIAGLVRQGENL
ncbi:rare lipoprotein A [Hymenobacter luteus]|uniref:Probable endolytic peptidoglycan transglycosylase RlpA n=2 Tax=Hymenobacter TaxID=89966 RepID=A0A7W9T256_9BACT|nr:MULTISPECIES: septal ring lytic transglycosylase RlpA family protein [Hymenobacter]MBB4602315.1 rare lipoprotein A [Hymenobacter latericoloratus]MBB6060207.1 rare lipoprotein A [Hymenobacter luteus]